MRADSTFLVHACRGLAPGRRRALVASNPTGCSESPARASLVDPDSLFMKVPSESAVLRKARPLLFRVHQELGRDGKVTQVPRARPPMERQIALRDDGDQVEVAPHPQSPRA